MPVVDPTHDDLDEDELFRPYPLDQVPWADLGGSHVLSSTINYFHGYLNTGEYRTVRRRLRDLQATADNGRTCIIFSYGGHCPREYEAHAMKGDVELLWQAPALPLPFWPLALIVASHNCLLRIKHSKATALPLHHLSYLGLVELFSFSNNLLDDLLRHVRRRRWRSKPGTVLGDDPSYFMFGVERGNPCCESGIVAFSSFGPNCPAELRSIPETLIAG